jgi:16S rRNA (adenine1518-N6/adenine1519-N6)-dimethyltransferase
MSRLSASVQFWADPKIIAGVPRTDFSPPPDVDSAVISLETKESAKKIDIALVGQYYNAVRVLFAQPRKTILNNLGEKMPKSEVATMLSGLNIDPKLRPQDLTIENIVQIAANF